MQEGAGYVCVRGGRVGAAWHLFLPNNEGNTLTVVSPNNNNNNNTKVGDTAAQQWGLSVGDGVARTR